MAAKAPKAPTLPPAIAANLIKDYNKAKTERSCIAFENLAANKDFVLADMARLRAQQYCLKGPVDHHAFATWMRPTAVDAALFSAVGRKDSAEQARLLIEKSKLSVTPEEKIDWVESALELAKLAKDEELVRTAQERLYLVTPCQKPEPAEKELLAVADDCRYHRQFQKAVKLYSQIVANRETPLPEKISALKGLRQAHKNNRVDEKYLAANLRLIKFIESKLKTKKRDKFLLKQYTDASILQVRALWTRSRVADALKQLARTEKRLRGSWSLSEIYWLKGRIMEEKGELETANRFLEKSLAQIKNDSEASDRNLWALAWNERRAGNLAAASERLQRIKDETQNEGTRHRATFWLAKVQLQMRQSEDATKTLEQLIADDPLGYYGLLAHQQLSKPIVPVKPILKQASPSTHNQLESVLQADLADALIQTQELDALQTYLEEIARIYKKAKSQDDVVWVRLLRYYAHAGLYLKLYENLNQISVEQRTTILENHPELLFPRPFQSEVQVAAKQMRVPEELIYSIMRQESAFNAKARSHADAYGLMQILPEVASTFAKKHSLKVRRNEDLYEPALNVKLGAALIREQMDKYRGQFIPAVASYNANDKAIHGWLKHRFRGDSLEFIEDIPYDETRGYVRLVMRNLIFYQLLGSKSQTIAFPKWVLELSALNN